MRRYRELSPEEENIIAKGHTEPSHTGTYDQKRCGVYVCKRCDAPLFLSQYQFFAGCGWPSFDDEIKGAVIELPDRDQVRTEIRCARCQAHLGHVFFGEHLTGKNQRYCVNSLSLLFIDALSSEGLEKAYFAGGCFWGVEHLLKDVSGVRKTQVGFMGGEVIDPSYEEVCEEDTGHLEVVEVLFDPKIVSFKELAKCFLEIHDPTQEGRQGPDIGAQYQSAFFYLTQEQKEAAEDLLQELRSKGLDIKSQIRCASTFFKASEEHQRYYEKSSHTPYCHRRVKRF